MEDSYSTVDFGDRTIRVTVTANRYTVANWIRGVNNIYGRRNIVIVGLDVEWRPNRFRGENNPAATLQLCVGNRCLIVKLIHIDNFPPSLWRFLRNPTYMFAGVGIANDVAKLENDWGLVCENLYDVSKEAVERWPGRFSHSPGLQELATEVLGWELEKPRNVTMSDWAAEELDRHQIHYACVDSFVSCRIGVNIEFKSKKKSERMKSKISVYLSILIQLIQLCVGCRCLIVQLIHIDNFSPSLWRFLRNPNYIFAGIGIGSDIAKLERDWGLVCENVYDVSEDAVEQWPERFSHSLELAREVLGLQIEKPRNVTMSDWAVEELDGN
ncbi:LOW QUALITY PROTEIN: hypothetical protein V2J09_004885 [Rumex salicifolius]